MQQIRDDDGDPDITELVTVGGRCSYVLLAILALILLYPELAELAFGRVVLMALTVVIVIATIYAVGRSRQRLIVASALASGLLGFQSAYIATGSRVAFAVGAVIFVLFMAYAIALLFQYLMQHGPITGDKLHAALTIYLLAAFMWAGLYNLLNDLHPDSFVMNNARPGPLDFYDMLYFSFTTMTSTGFGDVTPMTLRAESLVILEQIAGVFYVAVLIARLAGLYPPGVYRQK